MSHHSRLSSIQDALQTNFLQGYPRSHRPITPKPADPADTQHKRPRRASTSTVAPGTKAFHEQMVFLNNVKIVYPKHEIPEDMFRFIPDKQLDLIRPLVPGSRAKDTFVVKKKYATNVDERTFLSVYEFQINDHWIIWDYHTGYVFFTGLWKAAGNTKTDIVKLVENIPSISSQVRRVRGGFLKIQGTWLPFDTCKTLAKNFAFPIRYCLVPLFGEVFPEECLKPGDPHYGKLVDLNDPPAVKSRRRSSATKEVVRVTKSTPKKQRSHSDSVATRTPILELEEVLKASKQLHDLSHSSTGIKGMDGTVRERQLSFNYGGFVWSWHDDNNLKILGRDEEAIADDEEDESWNQVKLNIQHQLPLLAVQKEVEEHTAEKESAENTPPTTYTTSIHESLAPKTPLRDDVIEESIPKGYGGVDTILSAAKQLMTFGGSAESSERETPLVREGEQTPVYVKRQSPKMEIHGLLS